jgi:hypothetical protein
MSSLEMVGILSALLALVAFVANEYHIWENDNIWYDFINFISGVGLLYFAVKTNAVPFIITNIVWAVVSGIDVIKYLLGYRKVPKKR